MIMSSEERAPREDRPERSEGGDRPSRPAPRRYGGGRRKVCRFCVDHVKGIDYKDIGRLRMYVSDRGKIEPRRKTGTCLKHQRLVCTAIKRARHLAMLPYTLSHIRDTGIFPSRG
jgi:small subunit ribosomal protein S18